MLTLILLACLGSDHADAADRAAALYDVDARVLVAIAWHESNLDPARVNRSQRHPACGVMQTKAGSPRSCVAMLDVGAGYEEGARVLRYWMDRADGKLGVALRAYACGNWGLTSGSRSICAAFERLVYYNVNQLEQGALCDTSP